MICSLLVVCSALQADSFSEKIRRQIQDCTKITLSEYVQMSCRGASDEELSKLVVECPQGAEAPFRFSLRGDLFCFEPTEDVSFSIKVLKTCYLTPFGCEPAISTDMVHWKRPEDFFFGKATFTIGNEDKQSGAFFGLELNERKDDTFPLGMSVELSQYGFQH